MFKSNWSLGSVSSCASLSVLSVASGFAVSGSFSLFPLFSLVPDLLFPVVPNSLLQKEYLECHPGVALVGCGAEMIDEKGIWGDRGGATLSINLT